MANVKIVTDSNSGITQKEGEELGIYVLPMPFVINGEEFFEDINLDISRRLKRQFEDAGFAVVLTRETEAGLYGTTTAGYKKRDMQKRAEIINNSNPALVISVSTDIIFTPSEMRRLAEMLPDATYREITSPFGHDGFLVEADQLNALLIPFLR